MSTLTQNSLTTRVTSRLTRARTRVVGLPAAFARDARTFRMRLGRVRYALGNVGLLAVATLILGELIANEIQMLVDTQVELLSGIVVSALVVLLLAYRWARVLPGNADEAEYGQPGTDKLGARRGLVLLLGLDSANPDSAASQLFAQLPHLEYLAMVGTPQTEELGIAGKLTGKVAPACGLTLDGSHSRVWQFGNAESISDSEEAVSEALRWMLGRGLDPSEVVVDVSAGRRAMSYGAKDAADDVIVETQYLSSVWDPATNRPVPGTAMFKVIKAYH